MIDANKVRTILRNNPEFKGSARTLESGKDTAKLYPPNPYVTLNGHDGESPLTHKNLFHRKVKAGASMVFSVLGSVGANAGSVVNTASIARNSVSLASTVAHRARLEQMASKVKDGGSLHAMLKSASIAKATKGTHRAGFLALSAIPDLGLAGTAASTILTLAQKLNFKLTEVMDLDLAVRLHWQAFRELKLLGGRAGTGPALSIVHELTTRGLTGRFDFGDLHSRELNSKIMLEPAGYAVLLYKISQD